MSNIIGRYKNRSLCGKKYDQILEVQAMVGEGEVNDYNRNDVVFRIDDESVRLSGKQIVHLILVLIKRMFYIEPYSATDTSEFDLSDNYIDEDGKEIVVRR